MIRVLVADDHPGFRRGMCTLLGALDGVEVAGEAASGDEAVVTTLATQPDVVLMDLDMPGGGLAATGRIVEQAPHVAVLVLTMSDDDGAVLAALQAGARGYLVKGSPKAELDRALRTVADGGLVLGSALAHRMQALVTASSAASPASAASAASQDPDLALLSKREREVLDLMAGGHTNTEVARRLSLSPKTVRNVVSGIFAKLGTSDRVRVVLRARAAGLGAD